MVKPALAPVRIGHHVPSEVLEYAKEYGDRCYKKALTDAASIAASFVDPEWPNDDLSQQAEAIAIGIRGLDCDPEAL